MLCIGHFDAYTARTLSCHLRSLTAGKDDDVGLACDSKCLGTHSSIAAVVAHLTSEHGGISLCLGVVHQVAALGIEYLCLVAHSTLQTLYHGAVAFAGGSYAPRAWHVGTGVGQRSDECNLALTLQGKDVAFVLQEYKALASNSACLTAILFGVDLLGIACGVAVAVGIFKQSKLVLRFKDAATSLVDISLCGASLLEALGQCAYQAVAHHVHVQSCMQCQGTHLLQVAHAVGNHFVDAGVVAHYEAVEAPLLAQHVGQKPAVTCCRYTVDDVEAGHITAGTCIAGCLVGWKIFVVHAPKAHVHGVVVTSCFGCTIEGKVLYAGHHGVGACEVTLLIAAHHCLGNTASEEGILTIAFRDTSPACIVADVNHWAERPADAVGCGFLGSNLCRTLDGFHIPGARKAQRNGEDGLIAMDYVHAEDQGYAEAAFFDGNALQFCYAACTFQVEESANASCTDVADSAGPVSLRGSSCPSGR